MIQSLTEEKFEAMRRAIDLVAYTVQELGVNPEEAISILSAVESSDYPSYDPWRNDTGETQETDVDWWQQVDGTRQPREPYVYGCPFTSPLSEENPKAPSDQGLPSLAGILQARKTRDPFVEACLDREAFRF